MIKVDFFRKGEGKCESLDFLAANRLNLVLFKVAEFVGPFGHKRGLGHPGPPTASDLQISVPLHYDHHHALTPLVLLNLRVTLKVLLALYLKLFRATGSVHKRTINRLNQTVPSIISLSTPKLIMKLINKTSKGFREQSN